MNPARAGLSACRFQYSNREEYSVQGKGGSVLEKLETCARVGMSCRYQPLDGLGVKVKRRYLEGPHRPMPSCGVRTPPSCVTFLFLWFSG